MDLWLFAIFFLAACGAAATGAMFPTGPWYVRLTKPVWVPPNWVFPVVWTTLYLLMAFAAARVAPLAGSGTALAFWALQITLNTLWTPLFFGLRRLRGALPVIALLWLAVLGCTITHFRLDFWAGLAFVPYLLWVSVATALNFEMVRLNPNEPPLDLSRL